MLWVKLFLNADPARRPAMDLSDGFVTNHHILTVLRQVRDLAEDTDRKVTVIMAVQDDVNAAAATLVSLANSLGTVTSDLGAAVTNIQAEIAALQAANPAVDTTALNAAVA